MVINTSANSINQIGSIAIWCVNKTPGEKIELIAHFNLWKFRRNNSFLDIGLKLDEASKIKAINIFFPIKIKDKGEIEDLSNLFEKYPYLISSVFNEHYKAELPSGGKPFKVANEDEPSDTFVISPIQYQINNTPEYGGSVVSLELPEDTKGRVYLRFRCKSQSLDSLTYLYTPPNSIFVSAFFSTEIVDFRINETRTLSPILVDKMHREGEITFEQINCFLMREAYIDYVFSNKEIHGSRIIENHLWNTYVVQPLKSERIIAYHWKEKKTDKAILKDFNVFVKFRCEKSSTLTIAVFLIGLLIIGFLGSQFANLIYNRRWDNVLSWGSGTLILFGLVIVGNNIWNPIKKCLKHKAKKPD